jgi:hypothetical protein
MSGEGDYLLLKWHTLKGWRISSKAGQAALKRYFDLGVSVSGMLQHDSPEQKRLLCEVIDACEGPIQSDWTGEYFSKQHAKDYVMEKSA